MTVWLDDDSLVRVPGPDRSKNPPLPAKLTLRNDTMVLEVHTGDATFSVLDRRTGRLWEQAATHGDMMVMAGRTRDDHIDLELLHVPSALTLQCTLQLDARRPEFTVQINEAGELPGALRYPHPFAGRPGGRLLVPMNEGISYPVEDASIETFRLVAYGGHGICMDFWG